MVLEINYFGSAMALVMKMIAKGIGFLFSLDLLGLKHLNGSPYLTLGHVIAFSFILGIALKMFSIRFSEEARDERRLERTKRRFGFK